jgi:hypothetical protein
MIAPTIPPAVVVNYDALGYIQDSLMAKLVARQVTRGNLRHVYEDHLAKLEVAGFPREAGETMFWDTVQAARDDQGREIL